jgi:long-chain acyl-CoA synthetase
MRNGLKQHEASPFFDKIVFSKVSEQFWTNGLFFLLSFL